MNEDFFLWVGFHILIVFLLILDLFVFHRKPHEVSMKEAIILSVGWVAIALGFNFFIYTLKGPVGGLQFLTGYLIEKSLSIDNIFVFVLIFSYFCIPPIYQHKILYYGILGAIIMRISFILLGTILVQKFHFILYLFGIFLCVTAVKFFFQKETEIHPERNILVRIMKKIVPFTSEIGKGTFFIRKGNKIKATPLFLSLLVVESADLVFALDSIPAIFAVTTDPLLIYTSNIFAILGLRSLYFVLASLVKKFLYLKYALAVILLFIGVKMLIADFYKIPIGITLGAILLILSSGVILSWRKLSKP